MEKAECDRQMAPPTMENGRKMRRTEKVFLYPAFFDERIKKKREDQWQRIFDKYSVEDPVDDVIDIRTLTIIEDNGHIRGKKRQPFGATDWASICNGASSDPAPKKRRKALKSEESVPAPAPKGKRKALESDESAPAPKRRQVRAKKNAPGPAPKRKHLDLDETTPVPAPKRRHVRAKKDAPALIPKRSHVQADVDVPAPAHKRRNVREKKDAPAPAVKRRNVQTNKGAPAPPPKRRHREEDEAREQDEAIAGPSNVRPIARSRLEDICSQLRQMQQQVSSRDQGCDVDAASSPAVIPLPARRTTRQSSSCSSSSSIIPRAAHRARRISSSSSSPSSEDIGPDAADTDIAAPPAARNPVAVVADGGDAAPKRRCRPVLPPPPPVRRSTRAVRPVERYQAPANSLPRRPRLLPPSRRPRTGLQSQE
ncbi:serine/arginine repetitive matrix protein 1-like [Uloborus diversus]|uniref:serine/arginine repetitive matrix protein 1-like n=1 Tax=Uloborus diversus TaxID=327109 RepID=UPI0024093667|nr:serine/arginine repetitive matrix protein 1-like [Uloborus diversus]